ncbi:MAG: DMT family transporter [Bacillota bacterium]|nr:DMT family transporter [Bacillota bacterium]
MTGAQSLLLIFLALIGGASYVFIKVAAPAFGPLVLMAVRVLVAGLLLMPFAGPRTLISGLKDNWRRYLLLGAFNAALPYSLIANAALHLNASLLSIVNALTPLQTAAISAIWLGDRLTARKAVGLLAGLAGVVIAVGWQPIPASPAVIGAAFCSVLASFFYGLGGVYAKKHCSGMNPLKMAAGQQFMAALLLSPLALASLPERPVPANAISAMLVLAVFATALTSWLTLVMIRAIGPTKTLTVTFMMPVFGIILGGIMLKEAVTPGTVIGLIVILGSVYVVTEARLTGTGLVAVRKTR